MEEREKVHPTVQFENRGYGESEMRERAAAFFANLNARRSIRSFSTRDIPMDVVEECIRTAGTAPSGAHKQPWTFVLVTDPAIKTQIRAAAEEEETAFYTQRASEQWLKDIAQFQTGPDKPFIEDAPALIAVFAQRHGPKGKEDQHYYVSESVGLATGMLLAALQNVGLATLTHTPSPMGFLAKVLERPSNERAYMLIPVGYAAEDCQVPLLKRKPLDAFLVRK